MPELTIYDSQGERYDTSDGVETSSRIENFFFGGVRVYLEVGSTSELVVFFRARESKSGRAEQYYAVYRTEELRKLFDRFKRALRERVEGEFGMTLQTTSDDVELFTKLDSTQKPVPGSSRDHRAIESLLGRGRRLRFGVPSSDEALGLFLKYVQGDADTLAIAEQTAIDELDACDLAIEVGDYDDLEPLGETDSLVEDATPSRTTASGSDRPRATASNAETSSSGRRRLLKYGAVAGLGLVALVVVALAAVNVAAMLGYTTPAASPAVVVDDGDGTAGPTTLENVTIDGGDTHHGLEDGDNVTVTPDDEGVIRFRGETNQSQWSVELIQDGESVVDNVSDTDDGEFGIGYASLPTGDSEVTIAVGEDPESDAWPERDVTIHVTIEDAPEE